MKKWRHGDQYLSSRIEAWSRNADAIEARVTQLERIVGAPRPHQPGTVVENFDLDNLNQCGDLLARVLLVLRKRATTGAGGELEQRLQRVADIIASAITELAAAADALEAGPKVHTGGQV